MEKGKNEEDTEEKENAEEGKDLKKRKEGEEEEEEKKEDRRKKTSESSSKKKRRRWDDRESEAPIPAGDHLLDFKQVSFRAADVNTHLVCRLCSGYFRDAHTITECLHTFCKQCLLTYLKSGKSVCPHCKVSLGPHPRNMILHDRTMQSLVDKVFSLDQPRTASAPSQSQTAKKSVPHRKPASKDTSDPISFKVAPHPKQDSKEPLEALDKPYLKTSGKLKVSQLRKYLAKKLSTHPENLEILCKEHSLPAEHSVQFIKRSIWKPLNASSTDTTEDQGSSNDHELLFNYRKNDNIKDI